MVLLASSLLASPARKNAPQAAAKGAKGAKSQARKVSGSQPVQVCLLAPSEYSNLCRQSKFGSTGLLQTEHCKYGIHEQTCLQRVGCFSLCC